MIFSSLIGFSAYGVLVLMRLKRNRYAAAGDANGEAVTGGSRAGEGEKMDKLEREVLEYPG